MPTWRGHAPSRPGTNNPTRCQHQRCPRTGEADNHAATAIVSAFYPSGENTNRAYPLAACGM